MDFVYIGFTVALLVWATLAVTFIYSCFKSQCTITKSPRR